MKKTAKEADMGKVKVQITMSLDGFVAGPNPSVEDPLGEGGEQLHEWAIALKAFRRVHGMEEARSTRARRSSRRPRRTSVPT
jgi:hypothetical protein